MSYAEQIMKCCRAPRGMAQIQAVVGEKASVRVTVYNLVKRGKLVNLKKGTAPGLFVVADESQRLETAEEIVIPPGRFDATALIAAWGGARG